MARKKRDLTVRGTLSVTGAKAKVVLYYPGDYYAALMMRLAFCFANCPKKGNSSVHRGDGKGRMVAEITTSLKNKEALTESLNKFFSNDEGWTPLKENTVPPD